MNPTYAFSTKGLYGTANGIVDINASTLFYDPTTNEWSVFSGSFFATSTSSTIAFQSNDNLGDTTGNLIDAAYVTEV
jgi:hypothetical protein